METKNIYQKILALMAEVDYVQKEEKKVAGQYRFVAHDKVAAIIHPQLVKHEVAVIPTVKSLKQDGNRTEVNLSVRFVNASNPSDFFEVESWGYGIDTSDKGPGKAVSYAYKYALLKTFCLETGDDPDQDQNTTYEPQPIAPEAVISKDEALLIMNLIGNDPEYSKNLLGFYKIDTFLKLPRSKLDGAMASIKRRVEHRNKNASEPVGT